jgi:hypothetical protein
VADSLPSITAITEVTFATMRWLEYLWDGLQAIFWVLFAILVLMALGLAGSKLHHMLFGRPGTTWDPLDDGDGDSDGG